MSYRVRAEPPVLVFLAAAASPVLCGGRRPASPGCGGATPPRRCRRIQTLARCVHPHPHSHLNHSHQVHLPQQSPRVVECSKGWRSILTIRFHFWKPSTQGPSERLLILYNVIFHTDKALKNNLIHRALKEKLIEIFGIQEHASIIKVQKLNPNQSLRFHFYSNQPLKLGCVFGCYVFSHIPTNTPPWIKN